MSIDSAASAAPAIEIELPAEAFNRLMRHPAVRALGPSRAPWQVLETGRARRLSRATAPVAVILFQPTGETPPLPFRLRAESAAPPGEMPALGAALAGGLAAVPILRGAATRSDIADQSEIGAALASALRDGLTQLRLHAPNCRPDASPVGVHQSRVALRRMRSVLKLFRPALAGRFAEGAGEDPLGGFDARLRQLAAALGPARDWDVFLGGLGRLLAETLPDDVRLAPLHRRAAAARLAAYAALPPLLHGRTLRAVLWEGAALIEHLEAMPSRGELHGFASHVLARRHRRLKRAGAAIEALPPAELHALRLDGKRLRYAAELLAPLWEGQAARRYLRRLARLQEALGLANDAEVARGLVRQLGARGWALGVAEGLALGRASGSRDAALEAWAKWRKARRFWETG